MNDSSTETLPIALHAASEEVLASRVQNGCADSFTELTRRLQPRLLFVLTRRMQNHADAEDVTQKTLLRAYEKISLYDPSRKFAPWLYTIAIRLATDHTRKQNLPTIATDEQAPAIADPAIGPEQQALNKEQAETLWSVAEKFLKPDQWTALWLLYGEGQSVREIATTLGRTSVSVRVLLFRARKTLIPHLTKFQETAEDITESPVEAPLELARVEP